LPIRSARSANAAGEGFHIGQRLTDAIGPTRHRAGDGAEILQSAGDSNLVVVAQQPLQPLRQVIHIGQDVIERIIQPRHQRRSGLNHRQFLVGFFLQR
jgi:hypothetical protein